VLPRRDPGCAVIRGNSLGTRQRSATDLHGVSERIGVVHGVATGVSVQIEPAGQPDRISLGISSDRRIPLRPHAPKQ
jgi:hypothetical protein